MPIAPKQRLPQRTVPSVRWMGEARPRYLRMVRMVKKVKKKRSWQEKLAVGL